MLSISKNELKIFFTFFIIYFILIHWTGWNEYSSFALIKSVFDEGKFQIDNYFNYTVDRSYYNGHYYSNKAPGLSFISAPIYTTWKFIYKNLLFSSSYSINNSSIYYETINNQKVILYIENFNVFDLISQFLLTAFTSPLYSALLILLIYKFSKFFIKKENQRLIPVIIFSSGTLILPYAVVFFTHNISLFFVSLSFFILFISLRIKTCNKKIILAGLLAGLSFFIDNLSIIILFSLVIYLILFKKKIFLISFLLGAFLGILPQLLYNFAIFGNPLEFTYKYLDLSIWSTTDFVKEKNTLGFSLFPNPYVILELLIYPFRGLFFYSPILLIALIGFFNKKTNYKNELIFILISVVLLIYVVSGFWAWWGGAGLFGPRYLIFIMPFLLLPLIFSIKKINLKILKILIVISILINLSGLQKWVAINENPATLVLDYNAKEKVASLKIISSPIQEYYFPLFLTNGPRSKILESVLDGKIDIRDKYYLFDDSKMPFFSLLPVGLFLFFVWRKNISIVKFKNFITNNKEIFIVTIFLIFLLNVPGMQYKFLFINWYAEERDESSSFRWMSNNASIQIYSDREKIMKLETTSYHKNRTLNVYVNNELVEKLEVAPHWNKTTTEFRLQKGENIIRFVSKEGCDVPKEVENSTDTRCLSFAFRNI